MSGLLVLTASDIAHIIPTVTPASLSLLSARLFFGFSHPSPNAASAPHRTTISLQNHNALVMPFGSAVKVVCVPRSGGRGGLPASTILIDEESGVVKALVNARALTALRNAAGSLLAAQLLLPPSKQQPQALVVFGAGAQISAHIHVLFRAFPSLESCVIFNRTRARADGTALEISRAFPGKSIQTRGMELAQDGEDEEGCKYAYNHEAQAMLKAADLIVMATSSTDPLIPSNLVKRGAHVTLIGSYTPDMHEVSTALIRRAGRVVVDSRAACAREAGELLAARLVEEDIIELGTLVKLSDGQGEESDLTPPVSGTEDLNGRGWTRVEDKCNQVRLGGDVTIFKSVGVGAQDLAIAQLVMERAGALGVGTRIEEYDV